MPFVPCTNFNFNPIDVALLAANFLLPVTPPQRALRYCNRKSLPKKTLNGPFFCCCSVVFQMNVPRRLMGCIYTSLSWQTIVMIKIPIVSSSYLLTLVPHTDMTGCNKKKNVSDHIPRKQIIVGRPYVSWRWKKKNLFVPPTAEMSQFSVNLQ